MKKALRLLLIMTLSAVGSCYPSYTKDDPILDKSVDALTNADISRMVAVVKTNFGNFTYEFHPEWAPLTARHVIRQIKRGEYDGQSFHEVRPRTWILGGDPADDPFLAGAQIEVEEVDTPGEMTPGAVGLYHPDFKVEEGGTRFFVMLAHKTKMTGGYNVFGKVIDGMSTVERIGAVPVTCEFCKPVPYAPLTTVEILSVHLEVKR